MSAHNDVAEIIESLRTIAGERRPTDGLLQEFLGVYYSDVPSDDADARRLNAAYAAAVAHLELGRRRRRDQTLVQVLSPDLERDGWETDRTILMFVTDDAPFLVDTVRMVLDRYRLGIHLLVHPMLSVRRNDRHELTDVDAADGRVEAWTLIELDRCVPEDRLQLETDVRAAIDDVQSVVRDFAPMRERLRNVDVDDPLLRWLAEDNFVFLGSAIYDRLPGGLRVRSDSLLGECRSGRFDPERIDPPPHPGNDPVVIARTDAVATVHRRARMTSIAVRSPDGELETRFVGLLGSAAYRQSVFAIPVVGRRADQVVERVGAATESHTGRAVRHVIETLPRDVVFETGVDELADLVGAIVGLQERRIVRVFDVCEPVGPWTTVLAYVPQSRFTAALPDLVAALVSEYYGGEIRDLETLGGIEFARSHLDDGAIGAPRRHQPTRSASIDRASRTWEERALRCAGRPARRSRRSSSLGRRRTDGSCRLRGPGSPRCSGRRPRQGCRDAVGVERDPHVVRPIDRRDRRRVALPGIPPRPPGHDCRTRPGARAPGPVTARRASVGVHRRRHDGPPRRHRCAWSGPSRSPMRSMRRCSTPSST